MAIRQEIPQSLALAKGRKFKYRARCAWGGNHLRRLGPDGTMLCQVYARSEASGKPISLAVDGYRPHSDPLDPTYAGYWQGTGRPLIPLQSASDLVSGHADTLLQDDFTDTDGVLLKNHTVSPKNNNFWPWTDASSTMKIVSNSLVKNTTCDHTAFVELESTDHDILVPIYVDSAVAYDAGVMVRYVDENNYILARLHSNNSGQVELLIVQNGAAAVQLAVNTSWTITTGDKNFLVLVRWDNIRIFVDGTLYIDHDTKEFCNATKVGPHGWDGCAWAWRSMHVWRPMRFYEAFDDWSNWTLGAYGAATGQASSISGEWGKLTVASSAGGTEAGYSAKLNTDRVQKTMVPRDMLLQMRLGFNRLTHAAGRYSEIGIVISNDSSTDISAETNCVILSLKSTSAGKYLTCTKIVAGVATEIGNETLNADEFSENVNLQISHFSGANWVVNAWATKYGPFVGNLISHLNPRLYIKPFARTNDTQTVNGYFSDIGVFPERRINVGGEVGVEDHFEKVSETAWVLGSDTVLEQGTEAGANALLLTEGSATRSWAALPLARHADWKWTGRAKKINTDAWEVALCFCLNNPTGIEAKGYAVIFNSAGTYLYKDFSSTMAVVTLLKSNTNVQTHNGDTFEWQITKVGSRIVVKKDGAVVLDATDASYTSGCFAFMARSDGGAGVGLAVFEHRIAPRGFQQPVWMRVDRHMIGNPSFEDWDDQDGLTEDTGVNPNGWRVTRSGSSQGSTSRSADGVDGGNGLKFSIVNPQVDAYFCDGVYQRAVRMLAGHRYRASFKYKVENDGGGLIQGWPFIYFKAVYATTIFGKHMIQIATPTENVVAFDQWLTAEFDFTVPSDLTGLEDDFYIELDISCEYPGEGSIRPIGDFSVIFDQVMLEDVTAFAVGSEPALEWTETPVTYRSYEMDRGSYGGEDWWRAFYMMPMNITWRAGENFTWGLMDENGEDLFTSRPYTFVFPGSEWVARPEWIAASLGRGIYKFNVNQILFYPLYSSGVRWLLFTYGSALWSEHEAVRVMQGLATYASALRLDLELEDEVEADHVQVVILDADTEGAVATCQQVEIYNFADESDRISHEQDSSPEVEITMSRPTDQLNSLPDAATLSMTLLNHDDRYTPHNKFSPIYGPYKHADGLGDIRSGVPIRMTMLGYDYSAAGVARYAMRDDCFGDGYWQSTGFADNYQNPGFLRLAPSSGNRVQAESIFIDADQHNLVSLGVEQAFIATDPGGQPSFQWRVGLLVGNPASPDATHYFPTDAWHNSTAHLSDDGEVIYDEDPTTLTADLAELGVTGLQTITLFVEFQEIGTPAAGSYYVMIDHAYIYLLSQATEPQYETLMFLGSVGVDKNKGAALGITIDGLSRKAIIDAVDFTVPLDQPVPVGELNPLESYTAEDTMRTLCYLAGLPRQDLLFDATGFTFPTVIFRDQTMRENLQQLVQAIGGRLFMLRDGRLRYQNVAVNRSWTTTERQEFEAGIKNQVDTQTTPGELWADNVQWDVNHFFTVNPESQSYKPWSVSSADSWRFLSNGELVVMAPAGQPSKMQMVRTDTYDKSKGFTFEFEVTPTQDGYFQLWGYVTGIVDYWSTNCAWRVRLRKYYNICYVESGGQIVGGGQASYLNQDQKTAFLDDNQKVRVRLVFGAGSWSIYLNDELLRSGIPYTTPRAIRWYAYETLSEYDDKFQAMITNLNGRIGDKNTTREVWHDPNNRWRLDNNLHLSAGNVDDHTTYLDFGCPDYFLSADLYLDRSNAREGGWCVKYVDQNNWCALRFHSDPDGGHPNRIILSITLIKCVNGVQSIIGEAPTQLNIFEGSSHYVLDVSAQGYIRVYMSAYNPEWQYYTLWHEIKVFTPSLPQALLNSSKFAPYCVGGAQGQSSWDNLTVDYGSGSYMGYVPGALNLPLPGGGSIGYTSTPAVVRTSNSWREPVTDTYAAKTVIGADAVEAADQTHIPSYRLAHFRQKLIGGIAPIAFGRVGSLVSLKKDATANVASWGVFEVELSNIGRKHSGGLYDQLSNVDFFVQVSNDGSTWDAWVQVVPGQLLPATVAVKRYIRWKAEFWKSWTPWDTIFGGYNAQIRDQYKYTFFWKAHVKSVTVNWQIAAFVTTETFRATWNVNKDPNIDSNGIEMAAGQYSLGNPEANRVTALVNRWVEQSLTDGGGGTTDPFWESSELPTILDIGDTYVINAEYPNPSKQGSGGTLRHVHITVDSSAYTVNDGVSAQACGNALVSFASGQSYGTIIITVVADNTTINSALIDSVFYLPASDLYGTERVSADDDDNQAYLGRIIETETYDNAFAMSRSIAQDYVEAELVRARQYRESIMGVTIPIVPSVSLEQFGIIHNPAMGIHERQVALTQIVHTGFSTTISGEGVRSNEAQDSFAPLSDLAPTGAWATHRMGACASTYVMVVRDNNTGEEFNVYEWQQYGVNFRSSAGGEWINASDMDLRVKILYDQTGNGRDFTQATAGYQPQLVLEDKNGWPTVYFDGVDDCMGTSQTLFDFITNAAGDVVVGAKIQGSEMAVSTGEAWKLPPIIADADGYIGIAAGNINSAGDLVSVFNNDGSEDVNDSDFTREHWYVLEWLHASGLLKLLVDGSQASSVSSGNTGGGGALSLGHIGEGKFEGKLNSVFTFNAVLTTEQQELLTGYVQAN